MQYLNPKSVTFWAGVLYLVKAVAKGFFGVELPIDDEVLAGAGLIGLRKAIG